MQYGVNPFKDEGCTTCKFFYHDQARCLYGLPKNSLPHEGDYMGFGLSPCGKWEKGYEYIPDSWGQFRRIEADRQQAEQREGE